MLPQNRLKYSKAEDRDMVNFWEEELQRKNQFAKSPLGLELWHNYVDLGKSTRSAANLSSHFRKVIFGKSGLFELGIGRKRMLNIFRMWEVELNDKQLTKLKDYCKCEIVFNSRKRLDFDKTLANLKIAQGEIEDKLNVKKNIALAAKTSKVEPDGQLLQIGELISDEFFDAEEYTPKSVRNIKKSSPKSPPKATRPRKRNPPPLPMDFEIPDDISIDENLDDFSDNLVDDINTFIPINHEEKTTVISKEFREMALKSLFDRLIKVDEHVQDDLFPYLVEKEKEIFSDEFTQIQYLESLCKVGEDFLLELNEAIQLE